MDTSILVAIFGALFSVILWLLKSRDDLQDRQLRAYIETNDAAVKTLVGSIRNLYLKHDEDVAALSDLHLEVAREYDTKKELDRRFSTLDKTIKEGFHALVSKFDRDPTK